MRFFGLIILAGCVLFATPALAQDLLVGRVVSVDEPAGRLVLHVEEAANEARLEGQDVTVSVKEAGGLSGLVPGRTIRVWTGSGREDHVISAEKVSLCCGRGPMGDRTGVRSRINQGMGRGMMMRGGGRHGR